MAAKKRITYLKINFCHWRRKWKPTPVLLPGKSHGQRNLVGHSSWGRKESDTTSLHFSHHVLYFKGHLPTRFYIFYFVPKTLKNIFHAVFHSFVNACMCVQSLQSCPTLFNSIDCNEQQLQSSGCSAKIPGVTFDPLSFILHLPSPSIFCWLYLQATLRIQALLIMVSITITPI